MPRGRFLQTLAWSFWLAFVPMFFVVRYFEHANVFDSLGTWYTVIVTVVFSGLFAVVVALFGQLLRALANGGATTEKH